MLTERGMNIVKGIIIVVFFFVVFYLCGKIESTDIKEVTIVSIEDNTTIGMDKVGVRWTWETKEGFAKGDEVKAYINNNYTFSNLEDDIVIKIKHKN